MPLSARLRRILDRMEDENDRRLFLTGTEPRGLFVRLLDDVSGLTTEEFAHINTHRFWAEIREIHLMDLPLLRTLPPLPSHIQLLSLRNTGVRHLPVFPGTLDELEFVENRDLEIPNEIPVRIQRLTLERNGLRELPVLSMRTEFTINEPDLVEPFRELLDNFNEARRLFRRVRPITLDARREFLEAQRIFYRGLEEIWSRRKGNIRSKARNVASMRRLEGRLPEVLESEIASYLSGRPSRETPAEQMTALRESHERLPRGGRRTRKVLRKRRK